MRNLSMKKFGTPIGAAPGSASENVGLSRVGLPSTARPGSGLCLPVRRSSSPARSSVRSPARELWLRLWRTGPERPGALTSSPCLRLGALGVSAAGVAAVPGGGAGRGQGEADGT